MKISLFQGILYGVFGLAAMIGLFVFSTHTNSGASGGGVVVGSVVVWGTLPKSSMQSSLIAIAQTNTLLKDVTYVQKSQETFPADLASAIATGNTPDLVLVSQEELLSLVKYVTPIPFSVLPASLFTTTFVGEGNLLAAPDGSGYYGVPFLMDPLALFSNHAILSSNSIVKPPATWEELTGLVPTVTSVSSTKQISRSLIALGTYANVHNARGILSSLLFQAGVPITSYSNTTLTANISGATMGGNTTPGQAAFSFYTQFADPSKVSYTWNASLPDSQQKFLAGDLALYLGYVSEARFLNAANPNLNFSVTPMPQRATANLKSTYGLMYSFMIPRGAKNASGAYEAAKLLVDTPAQTIAAQTTGLAPARLAALASVPSDPAAAVAYTEALYASGWLSPSPSDTDQVFSSMINNVISGRLETDAALSAGESSLNSLLRK